MTVVNFLGQLDTAERERERAPSSHLLTTEQVKYKYLKISSKERGQTKIDPPTLLAF